MYCCPCERPGYLPEPYHIPGYGGHIPTYRQRNGATFGRISRDVIEDPCVSLAPCPILQPPGARCCPEDTCCRNPVGCEDIGCCDPVLCPPPRVVPKKIKPPCEEIPCDPCKLMACCNFDPPSCCTPAGRNPPITVQACGGGGGGGCGGGALRSPSISPGTCGKPACGGGDDSCCDPRAHHLNRGPYACPCKPEPDTNIYRCCESMSSSYAGHIPGFTFHSNGRTTGKATWGTKQYMNKCFYFNTFTKP